MSPQESLHPQSLDAPEGRGANRGPKWATILLTTVAIGVYLNSLGNPFVHDDHKVIEKNPDIRSLSAIPQMFLHDVNGYPKGHKEHCGSYRPLVTLSYAINHAFGGMNPTGYHILNVVIHAACSFLVYRFVIAVLGDWVLAFLAGLVFATHPVHSEAVNSITNRSELLGALFFLGALLCYLRFRCGRGWAIVPLVLFYFAGILSKESSIMVPAAMVALDWLFPVKEAGPHVRESCFQRYFVPYAAVGITALVYLLVRHLAVGQLLRVPYTVVENPMAFASPVPGFLTKLYVLCVYLRLLVWPVSLSIDYSYNQVPLVHSLTDPRNLMSLALVVGFAVCLAWSYRRNRPACFGLVFGIITFAIGSNLLIPIGTTVGERLLYLPSLGFCLLIVCVVEAFRRFTRRSNRELVASALAVLAVLYGVKTWNRNNDWRSDRALFESALLVSPNSVKVNFNLAVLAGLRGDHARAASFFSRTLAIFKEGWYPEPGLELFKKDGTVPARERVNRVFLLALEGLAKSLAASGQWNQAADLYRKALVVDSDNTVLLREFGWVLRKSGSWTEAAVVYEKLKASNPTDTETLLFLADSLVKSGKKRKAAAVLREACLRFPKNEKLVLMLIDLLLEQDDFEGLERSLDKVNSRFSSDIRLIRARYALALVLEEKGRFRDAASHLQFILKNAPRFTHVRAIRRKLERWKAEGKIP